MKDLIRKILREITTPPEQIESVTPSFLGTTMVFPVDSDNFNIGYDKQGLGRGVKPKVLDANKALHHCRMERVFLP